MKTFTLEQTLDLLVSMDMSLNPETYESSRSLDSIDFVDIATCKAQELGIEKEFEEARLKQQ